MLISMPKVKCDCGAKKPTDPHPSTCALMKPDWSKKCMVCGETPIVPVTEMCGPCTFGEADTVKGNW